MGNEVGGSNQHEIQVSVESIVGGATSIYRLTDEESQELYVYRSQRIVMDDIERVAG